MRPWLLLPLLAATLIPGCALFRKPPVAAPALKTPPRAAVRPADVTPANAREMARALNEELDADMDGELEP